MDSVDPRKLCSIKITKIIRKLKEQTIQVFHEETCVDAVYAKIINLLRKVYILVFFEIQRFLETFRSCKNVRYQVS